MHHALTSATLAFTLIITACADDDPIDLDAPPPTEQPDTEAEAGSAGDSGEPPPPDAGGGPEPGDDEPDGDGDGEPEPEPEDQGDGDGDGDGDGEAEADYLTTAVAITHTAEERKVEFVAVDDQDRRLGYIRLYHEPKKNRLWIESMYDDGVAWAGLGLELHTYVVQEHRSTLEVPVLERRARIFGDLLEAEPEGFARDCGLHAAEAMVTCAEATASGKSPRTECPTAIHRAACECLEPYPNEFACK